MQANDRNDIDKSASHIIHPGSRHLFRYWEALRAERACPTRVEIEMARLAQVLPNIAIMEFSERGHWHFRLAGSEVCEILQKQATGQDALTGFDPFERSVVSKTLNIAAERLQPALVRMRMVGTGTIAMATEMLALPVRASHIFTGPSGLAV